MHNYTYCSKSSEIDPITEIDVSYITTPSIPLTLSTQHQHYGMHPDPPKPT